MGRTIIIYGKQHSGKTNFLASASLDFDPLSAGACLCTPSESARDQIAQLRGIGPSAVITTLHADDYPLDWWPGPKTLPVFASYFDQRTGSLNAPPKRALEAGGIPKRSEVKRSVKGEDGKLTEIIESVWTASDARDPDQLAAVQRWADSVAYWRAKGLDPNRKFFWAPPGSCRGELAVFWTPHQDVIITDWQRIQGGLARWRGFVKTSSLDQPVDYRELGTQLGPFVERILEYMEKSPINFMIDSHPKEPGTSRGSSELEPGGWMAPTRSSAPKIASYTSIIAMLRPPNANVGVAVGSAWKPGKVTGELEKVGGGGDGDWDVMDLVVKPTVALEPLADAGLTSVLSYWPSADLEGARWITRDREKVLWSGGCPGALFGLYAGAGFSATYPFVVPKFIRAACSLAVQASAPDELYRAASAAVDNDAQAQAALGQCASSADRDRREEAFKTWALQEAYAAFVAAGRRVQKRQRNKALWGGEKAAESAGAGVGASASKSASG